MKAYIKKEKRKEFKSKAKELGFKLSNYYFRIVEDPVFLILNKQWRMMLVTPMGESPYMEAHKDKFQDLIDLDYIEFKEYKDE